MKMQLEHMASANSLKKYTSWDAEPLLYACSSFTSLTRSLTLLQLIVTFFLFVRFVCLNLWLSEVGCICTHRHLGGSINMHCSDPSSAVLYPDDIREEGERSC